MSDIRVVQDWLHHSKNNLIVARHSYEDLHPRQTEIACYLCQQCAETALKGYLVFKDIDPPHSHDLIMICEQCIILDNEFVVLREHSKILNPYGVHVRYPNELAVDETLARIAIDKAQDVYNFCMVKTGLVLPG